MESTTVTSLIDIREFLKGEGAATKPWLGAESVVDSLYALLRNRTEDSAFWSRLKDLTRRLEDHRVGSSKLRAGEVLGGVTIDRLIDDLRHGVSAGGPPLGPVRRWVGSALCSSALLGFMVLGTALGCDDGGDEEERTCEGDVAKHGVAEGEQADYCALFDIIQGSDLSAADKEELLDCLPGIDSEAREWWLEYLQNASAQEIADYLEGMLSPCNVCGEWIDDCSAH